MWNFFYHLIITIVTRVPNLSFIVTALTAYNIICLIKCPIFEYYAAFRHLLQQWRLFASPPPPTHDGRLNSVISLYIPIQQYITLRRTGGCFMWKSYGCTRVGGRAVPTCTSQSPRTAGILIKELNACSGIRNNPEG